MRSFEQTQVAQAAAAPPQLAGESKPERLLSLDAFRGLTIAGMILVNNPGGSPVYDPLEHAPWHGWTPTDFIFPFFLFMVGVAMTFSFDKRLARGVKGSVLMGQVFCRSSVLVLLGMIMSGFPNFRLITPLIAAIVGLEFMFLEPPKDAPAGALKNKKIFGWCVAGLAALWFALDFKYFNSRSPRSLSSLWPAAVQPPDGSIIRVVGVLPRIGLCYFFAALIMLKTGVRGRVLWVLGLLGAYWLIMKYMHPPAGYVIGNGHYGAVTDAPENVSFRGELNDFIDVKLLGQHLYRMRPDPEGLLSTIPAIATALLGVLTGAWLQSRTRTRAMKAVGMLVAGLVLLAIGSGYELSSIVAAMAKHFPIIEKIRPASYLVLVAGWALAIFSVGYYLVDMRQTRQHKALGMFAAALVFVAIGSGHGIGAYFPINKKIWTSSYVVFMAGWALMIFSACYFLIDVLNWKKWSIPFVIFGTNAIVAFFLSGMVARMMGLIKWAHPTLTDPKAMISLKGWTYGFFQSAFHTALGANQLTGTALEHAQKNASLAWALAYIGLWLLLLTPLYVKKIFVKV